MLNIVQHFFQNNQSVKINDLGHLSFVTSVTLSIHLQFHFVVWCNCVHFPEISIHFAQKRIQFICFCLDNVRFNAFTCNWNGLLQVVHFCAIDLKTTISISTRNTSISKFNAKLTVTNAIATNAPINKFIFSVTKVTQTTWRYQPKCWLCGSLLICFLESLMLSVVLLIARYQLEAHYHNK